MCLLGSLPQKHIVCENCFRTKMASSELFNLQPYYITKILTCSFSVHKNFFKASVTLKSKTHCCAMFVFAVVL